jgi:hypothetical protein
VDAVGADDDVGLDLRAVPEARDRDIVVRFDCGAPLAQRDAVGRQRGGDDVEQVRAVHRRAGQPIGGGLLRAADPGDGATRAAVARDEVLGVPGTRRTASSTPIMRSTRIALG